MKKYLEERICKLKRLYSKYWEISSDYSRPALERECAREMHVKINLAKKELEKALKYLNDNKN